MYVILMYLLAYFYAYLLCLLCCIYFAYLLIFNLHTCKQVMKSCSSSLKLSAKFKTTKKQRGYHLKAENDKGSLMKGKIYEYIIIQYGKIQGIK